jgi:hypothetical protein
MSPWFTGDFDIFAAEVLPILRDHFGLPRPDSLYAVQARASA